MRKAAALFCILSIMLALPAASFAETTVLNSKSQIVSGLKEPKGVDWVTGKGRKDWILHWAVDDNYLKKTPGMFLRGFSNAGFGWADILTHPIRWQKNAPAGIGLISGLIMGPVVATLRTTSGALDLATCWIPFWHGVPMSKPVLGLNDVRAFESIDDPEDYDHRTKRYFFSGLSEDF